MYKAAKDIQNKDKRKSFFFWRYSESVAIIALGYIWGLFLEPVRWGVYGYMFFAHIIFLHGFGMIVYTTIAYIAIKSLD
jgi:membrane protein YdbS with pleckstrin-like domain